MSAISTTASSRRTPGVSLLEEAAMPILIGSLAGGGCGMLMWTIAAARFGFTGWFW